MKNNILINNLFTLFGGLIMPEFNVIVHETNSITLAVEAENDIEAARLVEEDINKYEILDQEVIDWTVDFVEEV